MLLAAISCNAQQSALTVEDVLTRVRAHVTEYKSSIPNFICDESVDSQRFGDEKLKDEMKVESSFELVRHGSGDDLRETRIKNLVNGHKPKSQKFAPPFAFYGGFANVIDSMDNRCADYRFAEAPINDKPIVLLVSRKPVPNCSTQSYDRKAFIQPKTFQVYRIEETVQDIATGIYGHLPFVPMPSSHNVLNFSVDFMPVELGGKTFWLTKTVNADLKDKKKPIRLHYEAHYSNYHRFASTATILPGEPVDAPH
jgi:hypothetical protein